MPDSENLEALVPSDIEDLVPVFLTNRRKEVEALAVAVRAADFEQVRQLGHRMRGVGTSYGFDFVSDLGSQIEHGAKQADQGALLALIDQYADYLDRVKIKIVEA